MAAEPVTDFVFETLDYSNTPVALSRATWQAKAGDGGPGEHPEIQDYLDAVRITIEQPDLVFQSTRDPRSRLFYRLSIGRGRFTGKHLVVVVKYVIESAGIRGYVSTLYLSRTVYARGRQLWPKMEISDD
ncbi:MAG: hypothetical protein ACP5UQ_07630 [Anaerolineae bacterium]